jgi:hypothetical protein
METFKAYTGYVAVFIVYLMICMWGGVLAQSLSVFAISQTSFSLSSLGDGVVVGTAIYTKEKNQEDYDEYWRCPNCGGLVHPELNSCGCGFDK